MRYCALACDFDGTLASGGRVREPTVAALRELRYSGRRLLLVTGRQVPDLCAVFPQLELFDGVVAENGAVVYRPQSRETHVLCGPPQPRLVAELAARGVEPLAVGEAIVATWEPHERTVLEVIRVLGLELQVIFNKGAVMVLPSGVNKATGLRAALAELRLSPRNVVGIGDAENDHAFLGACECGVAVASALPTVQESADHVTAGANGAGVEELIRGLLASDLAELESSLVRHHVELGRDARDAPLALPGYGASVLVAGTSGSGKSTFASGLVERLRAHDAQVVVIDPEGDYQDLPDIASIGSSDRAPRIDEVLELLEPAEQSVSVNLLDVELAQRPALFESLLIRLHELRARVGRPHWIVVDEAHHLLPRGRTPSPRLVAPDLQGLLWITVHAEHLAQPVVASVDHVVALGREPAATLRAVAAARDLPAPRLAGERPLEAGEALLWRPGRDGAPIRFRFSGPRAARRRHVRKYAEGELGPDRSFYFRGPDEALRLRAANLTRFLELADGVDDATWQHHLARGDYSRWFERDIKDPELAEEARAIERARPPPAEARARLREAITRRYTMPA